MSASEIGLEGIGEMVQTPVSILSAANSSDMKARIEEVKGLGAAKQQLSKLSGQPLYKVNNEVVSKADIINLVKASGLSELKNINFDVANDQETSDLISDRLNDLVMQDNVQKANPKATPEVVQEISKLETQVAELADNKTETAKIKIGKLKKKITEIVEAEPAPAEQPTPEPPKAEVAPEQGQLNEILAKRETDPKYSFDDMVNDVEGLGKFPDAVAEYRKAQEYDQSVKGRGDMDAAEKAFETAIGQQNTAPIESTPPVSTEPIDYSKLSDPELWHILATTKDPVELAAVSKENRARKEQPLTAGDGTKKTTDISGMKRPFEAETSEREQRARTYVDKGWGDKQYAQSKIDEFNAQFASKANENAKGRDQNIPVITSVRYVEQTEPGGFPSHWEIGFKGMKDGYSEVMSSSMGNPYTAMMNAWMKEYHFSNESGKLWDALESMAKVDKDKAANYYPLESPEFPVKLSAPKSAGDGTVEVPAEPATPKDIFPDTQMNEFVYHGTSKLKSDRLGRTTDISEFDTKGHWAQKVSGAYFTPSIKEASKYAKGDGGKVYKIALDIRNMADRSVLDEFPIKMNGDEIRAELIKRGYDGVYDKSMNEVVAFNPEQIKIITPTEAAKPSEVPTPTPLKDGKEKEGLQEVAAQLAPVEVPGAVEPISIRRSEIEGLNDNVLNGLGNDNRDAISKINQALKPDSPLEYVGTTQTEGGATKITGISGDKAKIEKVNDHSIQLDFINKTTKDKIKTSVVLHFKSEEALGKAIDLIESKFNEKNNPSPPEGLTEAEFPRWAAEHSKDPNDVLIAYEQESTNNPATKLEPWQQDLLTWRFDEASFNRFGDRNNATFDNYKYKKAWFQKKSDGKRLGLDDFIVDQEGKGRDISESDVAQFITDHPNGYIRKTTDLQGELARKYKELTGKSIDHGMRQKQAEQRKLTPKQESDATELPQNLADIIKNEGLNINNIEQFGDNSFIFDPGEYETVKKYLESQSADPGTTVRNEVPVGAERAGEGVGEQSISVPNQPAKGDTQQEFDARIKEIDNQLAAEREKVAAQKKSLAKKQVSQGDVFDTPNPISPAIDKYGWKAETTDTGYDLYNSKGKKVVTVEVKGGKYTFKDQAGNKLASGNKDIGAAAEKLLNEYYYAKPADLFGGEIKEDVSDKNVNRILDESNAKIQRLQDERLALERQRGNVAEADNAQVDAFEPTAPSVEQLQTELAQGKWSGRMSEYGKAMEQARKSTTDKALDFLDKLKIDTKGKAFDATLGIPISAWNASIDIIKLGIKGGKAVADAIDDAVKYLKKHAPAFDEQKYRDLYKDVFDTNEKQLRADVAKTLETQYGDIEQSMFGSKTKTDADFKNASGHFGRKMGVLNNVQEAVFGTATDAVSNGLAKLAGKSIESKRQLPRVLGKVMNSLFQNMSRSINDVARKERFLGESKDRNISDAVQVNKTLRKLVDNDPESLRRIDKVIDPDFYRERTRDEFEQMISDSPGFVHLKPGTIDKMYDDYLDMNGFKDPNYKPITYDDLAPNEKAVADAIGKIYDFVHDANFAMGKTSLDTYIQNKGKYSARLYDVFEFPDEINEAFGVGTKMQQGMYKAKGDVDTWKLEHKIDDPIHAMSKRLYQTMLNKGVDDYSNWIISHHPTWISTKERQGYTQLGNGYGKLSGKFVRDDIAEDFKGFFFATKALQNTYDAFKAYSRFNPSQWYLKPLSRQFYRKLFTEWNPAVQLGNHTGNIAFSAWLGISPLRFETNFVKAVGHVKDYSSTYRYLLSKGLLNSDLTRADLINGKENYDKMIEDATNSKNPLKAVADIPSKVYRINDDLGKIAAFNSLIEFGMKPEKAVNRVADSYQNYKRVGKAYDITSQIPVAGNMFGRWGGDLARIVKSGITRRPLSIAAFGATLKLIAYVASTMSGETDDERKIREERIGTPKISLPDFMGGDIPLAVKVGENELNLARFVSPLYFYSTPDQDDVYQTLMKFSPVQWQEPQSTSNPGGKWAVRLAQNFAKDPVFAPLIQLMVNADFKGAPPVDPNETIYKQSTLTPKEKIVNSLRFLGRGYVPYGSYVDDFVRAMSGEPDYYGRDKTPTQVVVRFLGYNSQQFKTERYKKVLEGEFAHLYYQYKDNIENVRSVKKELASGKISEKVFYERVARFSEKQVQLQKKMEELRKKGIPFLKRNNYISD